MARPLGVATFWSRKSANVCLSHSSAFGAAHGFSTSSVAAIWFICRIALKASATPVGSGGIAPAGPPAS